MKTLAVMGLGYVGLPLAVQAAERGYAVSGHDLSAELVAKINKRVSPFANDQRLSATLRCVTADQLTATTSFAGLSKADTVVVCVPTPTEDTIPDLTYVISAVQTIAKSLRKGQLIILESTVNPGVTREEVLPILEAASGLRCGQDFYLAHCPERIDPGNLQFYVGNLNRVVGGITPACTQKAVLFYESFIDAEIMPLDSTEEAEFVKSWENSHRNVMIALAHEAAVICDALDMDVNNIIKGLQSKVDQFGLKLAVPGIGPGGHCIPEDIHYVIKKARQNSIDTRFLDAAADLNDKMPRYAVQQLNRMVRDHGEKLEDLRIALLGLAYKENIEDARRSPAIEVAHILVRRAGGVVVHDPYVTGGGPHSLKGIEQVATLEEALETADAVFVATAHDQYKAIDAQLLKKYGIRYVFDGRNCLDRDALKQGGLIYKGIGR